MNADKFHGQDDMGDADQISAEVRAELERRVEAYGSEEGMTVEEMWQEVDRLLSYKS